MNTLPENIISIESPPPRPPKISKDSASTKFLDYKESTRDCAESMLEKRNRPPPLPPKDVQLSMQPSIK